jgi:hypothetical protein
MTRLVLTGLLSLAALTGITGGATLSAQEPQSRIDRDHRHHDHYRRYEVYYRVRHGDHYHWRYYGSYRSDWEAHRAERSLEHRGYEARVQHPHRR